MTYQRIYTDPILGALSMPHGGHRNYAIRDSLPVEVEICFANRADVVMVADADRSKVEACRDALHESLSTLSGNCGAKMRKREDGKWLAWTYWP